MASLSEQAARLRNEKGLPQTKIDEYKAAFDLFDPERQGVITVEKLSRLLNDTFGQAYGADDLKYMLQQFDDTGVVDFFSFASTLHEKMGDPRYNEAFGDAFDLFDTGKIGELSRDDLQSGMLKLGERLTDAEAEEMLKVAKKKDDFVRAMSNAVAATASSGAGAGSSSSTSSAAPASAGSGGAPSAGPARPGEKEEAGMGGLLRIWRLAFCRR